MPEPDTLSADHHDYTYVESIVGLLRTLPPGHVIRWHDPLVFEDSMMHGGVDIWAPVICDPLRIGWAWTINDAPTDDAGPLEIVVPSDEVVDQQAAWQLSTINRALRCWAADHADRPDLRFTVDTTLISPMAATLAQAIDNSA
jgi:hypothetical protein